MKHDNYERVIFRESYNIYHECISYVAIFPDQPEFIDRISILEFCFSGDRIIFEPFGSACYNWIYAQKIIHKNDARIPELLKAIENYYPGEKFKPCEKMVNRKNVYYR